MKARNIKVGDCIEIISGFAFKSELFTERRIGLPVARIRDVVRGYSETYYNGDYPESAVISNGDLLIGMDGEFNIEQWHGGMALLNQRVCKVLPREGISNLNYVKYALSRILRRIEEATPFVTVKHLSSDDLKDQTINLPPLPEQKRIADLLDQADRLRRTRRYALELSDTFLPAVFLEMFADPVRNDKGWKRVPLLEVCDNITDGTHDTPDRVQTGVPFITSKNIRPYEIDLTEMEFVTLETHREIIKRCNPRFGDVLYTNIGVNVGNAVTNRLAFDFSLKNVALIQPDFKRLVSMFLESLLNNDNFKKAILQVSSVGGAQKFVSLDVLRGIEIILPPFSLQQRFASLVGRHERLRAAQREALRQTEHLFQTLLHQSFAAT